MRSWDVAFDLERADASQPLFLQIVRTIVDDICRGRLAPDDRLPGTRTLAHLLGVNRVTVLRAYEELAAEGWIAVTPARGARISADVPERRPAPTPVAPRSEISRHGFDVAATPEVEHAPEHVRNTLVFGGSAPDTRLVPVEPVGRAYRRVLKRGGGAELRYGDAEGHPSLRAALAQMLSTTRGLAADGEHVFVTRGSQMALTLVARALIRPGDVVAVEACGYRHAWESFRQAGASLTPIPVDGDGLDVGALERVAKRQPLRAVYVTPHHQFPTTVTLSAHRRMRILDVARAHQFAIVEDDYDHEFHYDGRPVLPLASLDRAGMVIYVGTLSKVLAPGLRIGYVVAHPDLLRALAFYREFIDMQGDHAVEAAVAELLEEGEVQRHVRRVRRVYQRRRDLLAGLLRRTAHDALSFTIPAGGVALRVGIRKGLSIERWAAAAMKRGVAFQTARAFTFDRRPQPFARLGFATLNESELREATARLVAALASA